MRPFLDQLVADLHIFDFFADQGSVLFDMQEVLKLVSVVVALKVS